MRRWPEVKVPEQTKESNGHNDLATVRLALFSPCDPTVSVQTDTKKWINVWLLNNCSTLYFHTGCLHTSSLCRSLYQLCDISRIEANVYSTEAFWDSKILYFQTRTIFSSPWLAWCYNHLKKNKTTQFSQPPIGSVVLVWVIHSSLHTVQARRSWQRSDDWVRLCTQHRKTSQ